MIWLLPIRMIIYEIMHLFFLEIEEMRPAFSVCYGV